MKLVLIIFILLITNVQAQESGQEPGQGATLGQVQKSIEAAFSNKWYEKIRFRGYAHFRYNRLLETNNKLTNPPSDRSVGNNKGFFLRRARLNFSGQVTDRVFIYIQPDYSQDIGVRQTGSGSSQNYLQIRDAYFDYGLTEDREVRLRTGITIVPFGFENMQSSSNRGPIDRSDAINTSQPNERDTGLFLLYSPTEIGERFKALTQHHLKGTGDYGMVAIGTYNGQTVNRGEENNDLHRVIRFAYPFKLQSGQYIEASLQAYEGKYRLTNGEDIYDARTAAALVIFPQPIGFQIEYTTGQGPEFNKDKNKVEKSDLAGGYVEVNYQFETKHHRFFPYVRYQEYEGGRKIDDGNFLQTKEWEFGTEWQPDPAFELTLAYVVSDRVIESATPAQNLDEEGQLLRVQAQFNY